MTSCLMPTDQPVRIVIVNQIHVCYIYIHTCGKWYIHIFPCTLSTEIRTWNVFHVAESTHLATFLWLPDFCLTFAHPLHYLSPSTPTEKSAISFSDYSIRVKFAWRMFAFSLSSTDTCLTSGWILLFITNTYIHIDKSVGPSTSELCATKHCSTLSTKK